MSRGSLPTGELVDQAKLAVKSGKFEDAAAGFSQAFKQVPEREGLGMSAALALGAAGHLDESAAILKNLSNSKSPDVADAATKRLASVQPVLLQEAASAVQQQEAKVEAANPLSGTLWRGRQWLDGAPLSNLVGSSITFYANNSFKMLDHNVYLNENEVIEGSWTQKGATVHGSTDNGYLTFHGTINDSGLDVEFANKNGVVFEFKAVP